VTSNIPIRVTAEAISVTLSSLSIGLSGPQGIGRTLDTLREPQNFEVDPSTHSGILVVHLTTRQAPVVSGEHQCLQVQ